MSDYDHLNDQQLQSEIAEYRNALKEATLSTVAVVAGEGRRVEFVGKAGISQIRTELRNLNAEKDRRAGVFRSGSLSVEIG